MTESELNTDENTQKQEMERAARRAALEELRVKVGGLPAEKPERERNEVPEADWKPKLPQPLAPLYAALAKAQGAFPEIPKNRTATVRMKTGGEFKFKYSDLSDLINATRKALSENGLAQFQYPEGNSCITVIAHESGAMVSKDYPIHAKNDGRMHPAQEWAIAYAYARRYGLSAMLGIASEETVGSDKSTTTTDNFESKDRDGILSVRGATVPDGATKAEKARIFAGAIEDLIGDAKTEAGLPGVWKRNQDVIDVLQDHFLGDYENVSACYAARETELKAEAP